jgi:hypothetical protein
MVASMLSRAHGQALRRNPAMIITLASIFAAFSGALVAIQV